MGQRGWGARPRDIERPPERKHRAVPRPAKVKVDHEWLKPGLSRSQRMIRFIESLPVTKGILAGETFKLIPSQVAFIEAIYEPSLPDGRRQVRLAVLSEARKNGKTGLVVALALAHMVGPEAEDRGEIPSAANDRE